MIANKEAIVSGKMNQPAVTHGPLTGFLIIKFVCKRENLFASVKICLPAVVGMAVSNSTRLEIKNHVYSKRPTSMCTMLQVFLLNTVYCSLCLQKCQQFPVRFIQENNFAQFLSVHFLVLETCNFNVTFAVCGKPYLNLSIIAAKSFAKSLQFLNVSFRSSRPIPFLCGPTSREYQKRIDRGEQGPKNQILRPPQWKDAGI